MENLIKALGQKIGDNAIYKDTDTQYTAEMQDFLLMINILESSKQILLSTCVANLPADGRQELYLKMLQGQYFFQTTAGGTLAVDNEEKFVVLQYVQSLADLSPETFINIIERFMQTAEYWRDICAESGIGSMEYGSSDQFKQSVSENASLIDMFKNTSVLNV